MKRVLRRLWNRVSPALRPRAIHRLLARGVFSLPGGRRLDPSRRMTTFREYCRVVDAFPGTATREPWYLPLGPTAPLAPPIETATDAPEDFDEAVRTHANWRPRPEPGEIFLAHLRHPRLHFMEGMLYTSDHRILADSLSHFGPIEAHWTDCFDRLGWPIWMTGRLDGAYVLLDHEYAQNYYHWLIEVLPRVRILQRFPELTELPCLVNAPMQPFHEATLLRVGIARERWVVRPRKLLRVPSLYYPSLTVQEGHPTPDTVHWLRQTFLPEPPENPRRRLYVSRRGSKRDVGNEEELMQRLAPLGFEAIEPARMPFEEQVRAFSEAEAVVAPHGAALASIVFSSPGLRLIELFPQDYRADYYRVLASACGHRHGYCVGTSLAEGFRIDPQSPVRVLEQFGVA